MRPWGASRGARLKNSRLVFIWKPWAANLLSVLESSMEATVNKNLF